MQISFGRIVTPSDVAFILRTLEGECGKKADAYKTSPSYADKWKKVAAIVKRAVEKATRES